MSDEKTPAQEPDGEDEERTPKRVIGTPQPAESQYLLPAGDGQQVEKAAGGEIDERHARKMERVAASFFLFAFAGGVAFILAYTVWPGPVGDIEKAQRSNYALGTALTIAFLGLAVGVTLWVRQLMTTKEMIQERGELASPPEAREAFNEELMKGFEESGIGRHKMLRRTLLLAAAPLGVAPIILLGDLGPGPGNKLRHTDWKKGTRLVVDGTGEPIRASDFDSEGGMITVLPEGHDEHLNAIAKSAVIIINIPPNELKMPKGKENWQVNGIVAYSKICTHVGCPAALYEQTTHHILCPCHQSTFDAANGAKVTFGPAARPLPMLPIGVDAEGYLIAMDDFDQPVGPSFWERGKSKDA